MLQPKKRTFAKAHKGKVSKLPAVRGITLNNGKYGLVALEPGRITNKEIEAARVTLNRKIKKYGALWIRIFPNVPVTKKPAEMRMGQGKGPVTTWIARVRTNKVLIEVSRMVPEAIAMAGLRAASFKLSVLTKIIKKDL
jgi:large subunit ribosomal protein L16